MGVNYLFIFLGCLAVSFLLSGMEAGVFALSRLRIRQQGRAGNRRAKALYGYLERPENFLWTILVGNTISNVTAFSIAVLGLYRWLNAWPGLFWLAYGGFILLFYALVELLPKTVFRLYPNRLCMLAVIPFRLIYFVLRPLVATMAILSHWILRWSGGKRFTGHLFASREELRMVMQESAHGLSSEERVMINRVLDLQNKTVGDITIPWSRVKTVHATTPVTELLELYRRDGISRVPVWQDDAEDKHVLGVVNAHRLLYEANLDQTSPASQWVRPVLYLDHFTRLEVALRQMQRRGQRVAIVLDKDQTEVGILSLKDVLRFMFGDVTL